MRFVEEAKPVQDKVHLVELTSSQLVGLQAICGIISGPVEGSVREMLGGIFDAIHEKTGVIPVRAIRGSVESVPDFKTHISVQNAVKQLNK